MLKSGLKLALCSAALAVPVMIGASDARAEVLATATRVSGIGTPGTIPLNDSGGTALAFSTTKPNQKIVLTYNAECFTSGSWLAISIFVDGKEANPQSGSDFAFCSAPGNWHGTVRQSIITVPKKGAHAATVVATLVGGGSFSLDDTSFVIEK